MLQPIDVAETLQPVQRRLGVVRAEQWALRGAGAGATAGIALLVAGHLFSLPNTVALALTLLVLGVLGGVLYGVVRRPDFLQTARTVDRHFALDDRVTTAVEFQDSDRPLMRMQRDDAATRIRGLQLTQSARGQIKRREVALPVAAAVGLVALLLWGGTSSTHGVSAAAVSDQRHIHTAATTQLPRLTKKLQYGLTPQLRNTPALRKLEAALANLRKQLLRTSNRTSALRTISATQQQLRTLAATLHPINSQAVARLNASLAQRMTTQEHAAAGAGNRQSLAAATQLMNRLAKSIAGMSAKQRAALARQLAQAANTIPDNRLRASLRQAASSLAYGDPSAASSALQQAASALAQTPGEQAASARLQQASGELDAIKNGVAGMSGIKGQTSTGTGAGGQGAKGSKQGQPGLGTGQGKGKGRGGNGLGTRSGSGRGSGASRGNGTGRGTGSGRGTGRGTGSGSGQGRGGTGGHGLGGGRGGAGNHGQGRYATVYVPARQGNGPHTLQTGPSGTPQGGIVPYQQVVGQYTQAVHAALDRSALPPPMRSFARRYFAAISH